MSHPLYRTARWQKLRAVQLAAYPLCVMCRQMGRINPATVADHVEPHKGDVEKFWTGDLQSLCKHCHDSHKKSAEITGVQRGCGVDGQPLDKGHHWHR